MAAIPERMLQTVFAVRKLKARRLTNPADYNRILPFMIASESNHLCLECGLCCNGVLFANGQLRAEDNEVRLLALGLRLVGKRKFCQPCAAFDGCSCGIYSERPTYCRQFECLLLKRVNAGEIKSAEANRIIRRARKRSSKVKQLLRDLGDTDESVALSIRFRRMQRRMESQKHSAAMSEQFGELTLAMHDLNMLLSEAFFPGNERL